jgi:hypothetical protein
MQPQNPNDPLQSTPATSQPVQAAQPPLAPATPVPTPVGPVAPQPAIAPVSAQPQPVAPLPQPAGVAIDQALAEDPDEFVDDEEYEEDDQPEAPVDLTQPVNWQATEYIHQEKDGKWFILFGIVVAILLAIAIFFMGSWTFAALLVVIAVVIVVLAKRPPRIMSYSLSEKGLHIGDTLHAFSDFRAFGIIHDGQEYSVMLIPTRRFLPGITVYFPEEQGEKIVDALGSRLPMQDLRLDIVDQIVRKLRLG